VCDFATPFTLAGRPLTKIRRKGVQQTRSFAERIAVSKELLTTNLRLSNDVLPITDRLFGHSYGRLLMISEMDAVQ
jgi:hypothetical protein